MQRRAGQDPYAVISYDYWRRRFGGNPSVLGTTIRIHNATLVIIGVAAPGFRGETVGQDPDLWLPLLMQPLVMPGWDGLHDFMDRSQDKLMWLHAFGRRKPGVTIAAGPGGNECPVPANPRSRTTPTSMTPSARKAALNQDLRVRAVRSGAFHGREEFSQQWTILSALAGLVLLIACANIANLLLARAAARTREVAIRLSMGAGKARMVRQFLVESLLLATLGGIAGIVVAAIACRVLPLLLAHGSGGFELAPEIDLRVLAFTAGTVLMVGILFGLAPAFRATNGAIHESLKESGRAATRLPATRQICKRARNHTSRAFVSARFGCRPLFANAPKFADCFTRLSARKSVAYRRGQFWRCVSSLSILTMS